MENHDISTIIGKLKMKITLIQHSLSEMDKIKANEHIERTYALLEELKKLSYEL